jgi:hypothetical protein
MAAEGFHFPKSRNLMAGAYDPDTQELSITFRSGETYSYRNVPQGIVAGLKAAGSAGEYFAQQIRPRFPGTRL